MNNILPGQKYRHFKGNEYEVVCIARHTESEEDLVIYRSLKNPDAVYARPVEMFTSRVDRSQYPDADQEFRFELAENAVDPGVMEFLDAETFGEKALILSGMRMRLSSDMIKTISIALDFEMRSADIDQCYEDIMNYLTLQAKYETNRLR